MPNENGTEDLKTELHVWYYDMNVKRGIVNILFKIPKVFLFDGVQAMMQLEKILAASLRLEKTEATEAMKLGRVWIDAVNADRESETTVIVAARAETVQFTLEDLYKYKNKNLILRLVDLSKLPSAIVNIENDEEEIVEEEIVE